MNLSDVVSPAECVRLLDMFAGRHWHDCYEEPR